MKEGRGRTVPNFKYKPGGRQPKNIWLPFGAPADGQTGGNVLCVASQICGESPFVLEHCGGQHDLRL